MPKRTVTITTWFYTYKQNNSGGNFLKDENVAEVVIIEAASSEEADAKAKSIGIYFDGCEDGRDCNCCGDRWSTASYSNAYAKPGIYGVPIQKYRGWFESTEAIIYFVNGKKKRVKIPAGKNKNADHKLLKSKYELEEDAKKKSKPNAKKK